MFEWKQQQVSEGFRIGDSGNLPPQVSLSFLVLDSSEVRTLD